MPMFKRGCVVLLLISAAACWLPPGPGSDTASASVDGTWVGTTSDNLLAAGNIRATISQSGASLSGTWASTNSSNTNGGMLSGSVNGSSVSVTLTPSIATTCPLSVTATVNGSQMTGTYAAASCTVVVKGSITLTKQ
jgi:hypothetical protein